jgi:hypothetical protein
MNRMALVLLFSGLPSAFGQSVPASVEPVETAFREGEYVTFSGLPVKLEFQEGLRISVLRFGVATRHVTLPCYDEGTNTRVLRDLHSRLGRLVNWNGARIFSGGAPVEMTVRGWFNAEAPHLRLDEVFLPRITEATTAENMVWDRFDPNRDDRLPSYAGGYRIAEYESIYPPTEEVIGNDAPLGTEYGVSAFQPPVEYPARYYPQAEYEPPYRYRVGTPPSGGIRVDGGFITSGPRYDDCYYDGYTYWNCPWYYYPYYSGGSADDGGGSDSGDGGDGGEVSPPTTGSGVTTGPRVQSRAEKWGQARQIGTRLNNPTLRD